MRYSQNNRVSAGFTLIEMLIIAPIIIIFIGVMIVLITSVTGDSLQARERNTMAYNVQNALDLIETEGARSGTYPKTTGTLTSPQGSNGSTAAFTVANNDASSTDNDVLIIKTPATTTNPIDSNKSLIYYNSPNSCSSADVSKNDYYPVTTVYFVVSGSLWQRTILPDTGTPCSTPWQRASCAETQTLTGVCKAYDEKLVTDVTSFSIQYLKGDGTPETAANANKAKSVNVSISTSKLVAGKSITYSGSSRSVAMNNGAGDPVTVSFAYTGNQQTWTVPAGVTSVEIEAWGAQGANGSTYTGGLGGYSKGKASVTPGETLYINVGGVGVNSGSPSLGGWNGGGAGYVWTTSVGGGGGGGASDVRKGGTALSNRVIIAGGGGGSSSSYSGGSGGGANGFNAGITLGGTQSAGGTGACSQNGQLGIGGTSASGGSAIGYGGGGGGYYGGGAGCYSSGVGQPGGGGSGYAGGATGTSNAPGLRTGNGEVKITYGGSVSSGLPGPIYLSMTPPGTSSTASWNSVAGTTYTVRYGTNGSTSSWTQVEPTTVASGCQNITTTQCTLTGLTTFVYYTVSVTASNSSGSSTSIGMARNTPP